MADESQKRDRFAANKTDEVVGGTHIIEQR